jgi:hypothetical protein
MVRLGLCARDVIKFNGILRLAVVVRTCGLADSCCSPTATTADISIYTGTASNFHWRRRREAFDPETLLKFHGC